MGSTSSVPTTPAPATADGGEPAALAALSAAALAPADETELTAALVPAAFELLDVDQLHLIELSADGAVGHATVLFTDGRPPQGYTMVIDDRPSGTATVAASGAPLHVGDAATSELLRPDFTARFGVGTALFVPLTWAGAVRWVAVVIRGTARPFAEPEIDRAQVVLNLYAAGLALLEARGAAAAREDQHGALARAAAALNRSRERDPVLAAISAEVCVALGGDSCGVYLADGTGGGIATAGHGVYDEWFGYRMKPGEGVGGRVLQTGRAAFTNAYQQETELPAQAYLRRLQTAVAVPMLVDGELVGALSVGYERLRRIDDGDLRTLEAFADLAAVACR